jgi:hypothetical protein
MANSKKENKNVHFKCLEYRIYDIDIKFIVILSKRIKNNPKALEELKEQGSIINKIVQA